MATRGEGAYRRSIELPPIDVDTELNFAASMPRAGLDYWRKKAAGRPMPLRGDIRPEEIAPLLPNLCLFEMKALPADGVELFPRLAGARFEEVFGPIHNRPLATRLAPEILERWRGVARAMLDHGGPIRAVGNVLHEDKTFIRFEILLAPLSKDGTGIDMIFLVAHFSMRGDVES
ncbi:MAG: PAS domain-containing protein [Parvibaculum sp.]|uniref:PAS domain-containing protein n=1 Tax=Parvibaculum sp. TaxID=2024848 RepID=UPI002716F1BE|nr:PAS domain-containing protein [Parvibaculum sp.]MDO8839065.1 PAS domain-containing protein [Parvibaculum sp.]